MTYPTPEQRLKVREYPDQSAIMDQKWRRMIFLHWEYDPAVIQSTLPPGLVVDTFDGKAYLSIVAFDMEGVKPKYFPSIPGFSNFSEANVRTYVYNADGVPGVWFYSLDANQFIAVQMARQFFSLPYRFAKIESKINSEGIIDYQCQPDGLQIQSQFVYQGVGNAYEAKPESLDYFLTERYVLFVYQINKIRMGKIHHQPYPVKEARVDKWDSLLIESNGFNAPGRAPERMAYSTGVDVEVFPLI